MCLSPPATRGRSRCFGFALEELSCRGTVKTHGGRKLFTSHARRWNGRWELATGDSRYLSGIIQAACPGLDLVGFRTGGEAGRLCLSDETRNDGRLCVLTKYLNHLTPILCLRRPPVPDAQSRQPKSEDPFFLCSAFPSFPPRPSVSSVSVCLFLTRVLHSPSISPSSLFVAY